MARLVTRRALAVLATFGLSLLARAVHAQSFGVELNNTLMPASGGMAGASIAQPQDLTSSLNGNPAALTQFRGTQFIFGGAWAEPTFNLTQTSNIPVAGPALIQPYSAKSTAPGFPVVNVGATQDLSELGLPATFGVGFISTGGGFVDFRQIPESRGTNAEMALFSLPMSLGIDVTERLSVGATTALGIALFDGPFVGTSGMTPGYALRGTLGANYRLTDFTTVGGYYQTQQHFKFDNAFILAPGPNQISRDVRMDLPQNVGFGAANHALMEGNLLIAVDVLYKLWDQADLFKAIYNNQWVVQIGSQYSLGRYRLRAGYAWAQNPLDPNPGPNIGGVVQPGGLPAVRYTQGLLAIANQHRISGGIGIVDVLPGVNFDLMAGGMFRDTEHLGSFTTTSVASYWIGFGLTWQFGRGSCCSTGIPNSWCDG